MKESLVAINIVKDNNILLNPTAIPILLYWNDKQYKTIDEEIFNNENSYKYIISKCANIEAYTLSKISFFYFKDTNNDNTEDYLEYNIDVQQLFKLSVLNSEDTSFYKDYINESFKYLYLCSFKEDYEFSTNPLVWEECIIDIFDKLRKKYPNKISKDTIINYVRSELLQKYKLNTDNSNWIIDKLKNILVNEI